MNTIKTVARTFDINHEVLLSFLKKDIRKYVASELNGVWSIPTGNVELLVEDYYRSTSYDELNQFLAEKNRRT